MIFKLFFTASQYTPITIAKACQNNTNVTLTFFILFSFLIFLIYLFTYLLILGFLRKSQAGLELANPNKPGTHDSPASASSVLRLQAYTSTPGFFPFFFFNASH
jgi:hypothetical protein